MRGDRFFVTAAERTNVGFCPKESAERFRTALGRPAGAPGADAAPTPGGGAWVVGGAVRTTLGAVSALAFAALMTRGFVASSIEGPSPNAAATPTDPAPPAAATATDPRPVVRLRVKNLARPQDIVFAQVMEGRLIADLADMETFRTVSADAPGEFLLTVSINNLDAITGEVHRSAKDAESGSTQKSESRMTVSMDLDLRLEDASGKEIYTGRMSTQGTHEMEASLDRTLAPAREEMIDRAAQKIERLVRKRLKKL